MRARLRYLTDEQIKKLSNGCGGKGSIVPTPQFLFRASCDKHDVLYTIGGTEKDRRNADEAFYRYMKIDVDMQNRWVKRKWYAIIAYTYYKVVRWMGKKYFRYGEPLSYEQVMQLIGE